MRVHDRKLSCKTEKLKDLKHANQRAILNCLQSSEELSISEIANTVRLSKTTVAQTLNSLVDRQIVLSVC
jgi:predicted transcriptional regulator